MNTKNTVFIATSLDGYIADKDGKIDWLQSVPNPDQDDMGYGELMRNIDALIMGRTTFETVCSFEGAWPYSCPVFVLSRSLRKPPEELREKVTILQGEPQEILKTVHNQGYKRLYIDGGRTIQDFIAADLIDELILTTIPILLGGGFTLFGEHEDSLDWELVRSRVYLDQVVQNHYKRKTKA